MVESPGWPPRNLACLSPCGSTYLGKLFGFTYQGNRTITRCSNATIYCRESGMFFMLASLTEAGGCYSQKSVSTSSQLATKTKTTSICVESFGNDPASIELQAMVINALSESKRFALTENSDETGKCTEAKADAVLKGVS